MFSFFKKKKKIPLGFQTHPNLSNLKQELTEEQKVAIFYTLFIVYGADGPNNTSSIMNEYISEQAEALDFSFQSESMMLYKSKDTEHAYEVISSFSTEHKKWYSFAFYSMLYDAGDKPSPKQEALYLRIGQQTSNPFMR